MKMVTDQNHSSDISSEQEVIRRTEKIAQLFELDKQNAKVYSALSGENRALKKQLKDYHSQYNTLKKRVKKLERDVHSFKVELEDLDESVDRETVVDLIYKIVLILINEKSKGSAYLSESSEDSDSVEIIEVKEKKAVFYRQRRRARLKKVKRVFTSSESSSSESSSSESSLSSESSSSESSSSESSLSSGSSSSESSLSSKTNSSESSLSNSDYDYMTCEAPIYSEKKKIRKLKCVKKRIGNKKKTKAVRHWREETLKQFVHILPSVRNLTSILHTFTQSDTFYLPQILSLIELPYSAEKLREEIWPDGIDKNEIKVSDNTDEVDKFWYGLLLQGKDSIVDYYSKIKRCNDVIKLCKNHLRELFHKGLSSESQRYIARFRCYYNHNLDPDKMVEMLIQTEKENVSDLITAFSDYLSQVSND
ncbi:hypothetical protein GLOIN_2v1765706 [Rhizophagus clarus]|uniref:Uncharacterized protein n=1 Tax=Rhizophagus clarus TaxID=94130 RepID=A0A8H3KXW5_9GLOM|nr:hypothetical protein GLOIN_2v1765706 [Rhizophagus clarus]